MKKLLALMAAFCVLAFAASPTLYQGVIGSGQMRVKPQAVPTSTTIVTTVDSDLLELVVSNPTAGAITVTVCSGEASPICLLGATSIAANTTYIVPLPYGYWLPSGFTITSSGSGLTYYAMWRQ